MSLQETMTPRERVLNALAGKAGGQTPVSNPTNVATVELMDMVDAPFPDANRDPEMNARLAATATPSSASTRSCRTSPSFRSPRRSAARCSGRRRTTGPPCG